MVAASRQGVPAKKSGFTRVGPHQAQPDTQGGGFTGTVGSQKAMYLTRGYREVEAVKRARVRPKVLTSLDTEIAMLPSGTGIPSFNLFEIRCDDYLSSSPESFLAGHRE